MGIWRDGEFTARWVAGLAEDWGMGRVGTRITDGSNIGRDVDNIQTLQEGC